MIDKVTPPEADDVCRCAYEARDLSSPTYRVYRCPVCAAGRGPDFAADGDR